jgi:GTPase SAR1 family protein
LESFHELQNLKIQIEKLTEKEHLPIVLVGNKNDLEFSRQVSQEMGKNLAAKWGAVFFETSAKKNVNVNETFIELVKQINQAKLKNEMLQLTCTKRIDSCKTM